MHQGSTTPTRPDGREVATPAACSLPLMSTSRTTPFTTPLPSLMSVSVVNTWCCYGNTRSVVMLTRAVLLLTLQHHPPPGADVGVSFDGSKYVIDGEIDPIKMPSNWPVGHTNGLKVSKNTRVTLK